MLKHKGCNIRPISEGDLALVLQWRNSERIRSLMFTDHVITMEEHLAWYKKVEQGQSNGKHLIFEYYGTPLGQVNITQIDQHNSRCYWGFFIGENDAPKGSGMAMGYMAIEFIFEILSMHKLCSEAMSYNTTSIQYHKKLGFIEEGYFKRHILKQGIYHDIVCLAMLQENWQKNKQELLSCCFDSEV
jgi:UDP-4-amino-4,6-dideoxy-N-acetyl-beta-L-altrosamine N-acetyltransferase